MASGDVLAFLQSDWVALWAATLHNSMYGNVPGLFSPYKIGLDAPCYPHTIEGLYGCLVVTGSIETLGAEMCSTHMCWQVALIAASVTPIAPVLVPDLVSGGGGGGCSCMLLVQPDMC